jgi:hypothetical protein
MRSLWSSLRATSRRLSGLKARAKGMDISAWRSTATSSLLSASHRRMVLSQQPEAISRPSGLYATG